MNWKRLWLLALAAWRESGRDNVSQMAAGIAYRVLFAVVPLTMFTVSVLGLVAGSEARQDDLVDRITEYLRLSNSEVKITLSEPGFARISADYGADQAGAVEKALGQLSPEEEAQLSARLGAGEQVTVAGIQLAASDVVVTSDNLVVETLRSVVAASGPVSVVSFALLAFSASGLFGAVRRSLDFVWGVRVARPMFQGKALDLAMLAVLIAVFLLMIIAVGLSSALRALNGMGGWLDGTVVWWLGTAAASWAVTFVVCAAAFRYLPQVRTRFRDVWLGAAVVATGLEVLKLGFSIYVAKFDTFDLIYGALGGVLLFLLLVYWASYIFLIGAEVAAEYPRVRAGEYDSEAVPSGSQPLWRRVTGSVRALFVRDADTR